MPVLEIITRPRRTKRRADPWETIVAVRQRSGRNVRQILAEQPLSLTGSEAELALDAIRNATLAILGAVRAEGTPPAFVSTRRKG